MTDLSQDELTVLLIAAKGEAMIPIGRWKPAVESLIRRGYMKPLSHPGDPTGHFNNYITPEGQIAADKADNDSFREMITTATSITHEQKKARAAAEQIAVQLVDLAEASSKITGDDKVAALEKWSRQILTRALEMIQR